MEPLKSIMISCLFVFENKKKTLPQIKKDNQGENKQKKLKRQLTGNDNGKKMLFFCFVLLMKIAAGINWDTLHLGEKRKGNNNNYSSRKPDDHQTLIVKVFDLY